ncbi:unnamed protein product [Prorocentrum cordatum]|uniref:Uncharacterized protein n=1 Tax=Prorocentrum cordatum TaxID=2364126 RepID=A0ABN9WJG6_9DINO|nr:unnamed protein product [Polarella glacialis]
MPGPLADGPQVMARCPRWAAVAAAPPPYCGRLRCERAEVLVIGEFGADVCLVELDNLRFSRLADEDAGDEFYQAFVAADGRGALVVPGDVAVSSALDGLVTSFRRGLAEPLGHLSAGLGYLACAVGLAARPDSPATSPLQSRGIFVPAALVADGPERTAPLVRAVAVGACVAALLDLMLKAGADSGASGPGSAEASGAQDISIITVLLLVLVFTPGLLVSAFSLSFLRSRDEAMALKVLTALGLRERLERRPAVTGAPPGQPLWCRWVKKTWAAFAPPPSTDGRQLVPDSALGDGERASGATAEAAPPGRGAAAEVQSAAALRPLALPTRPRPDCPPTTAWLTAGDGAEGAWAPLFTVRRPLAEGETRRLSLFEPRFLALLDSLRDLGSTRRGLRLAVVFAPLGSERPLALEQAPTSEAGLRPPLSVEVDAVLEGRGRVVEVETVCEALGEDGQRRWRLEVRGTSQTFCTRSCALASDELGALWAAPPGQSAGAVAELRPQAAGGPATADPVRCVVVVGLLHVNGVVRSLSRLLGPGHGSAKEPDAPPAVAVDNRPRSAAKERRETRGSFGGLGKAWKAMNAWGDEFERKHFNGDLLHTVGSAPRKTVQAMNEWGDDFERRHFDGDLIGAIDRTLAGRGGFVGKRIVDTSACLVQKLSL